MFKRDVLPLSQILQRLLREGGFETPLNQKRLVESWSKVAGPTVAHYTSETFIKNQTLFVKLLNPALRQDLLMMRSQLICRLNAEVGSQVITDIRFY
ncbi:MAG: DciA family protein [Hoylesella enoeca]|uniref:DciA family protein n=1 Tax=Hoylesella enoeca TaxID=76123 RepID=UPI003F9F1A13